MLHCSLLSLGCAFGFSPPEETISLTALRALKIAQRRLRPDVRSRLLSVTSSKTAALAPDAWRFVFFDPGTSGKSRAVTVAAKTSSEHRDTVEAFSSVKFDTTAGLQIIPQNRWTIDSDVALIKVREQSKLKGVRAAQYRLERSRASNEASWLLEFFGDHGEMIASYRIDARSGELHRLAAAA
jgi:hypothetical protein